MMQSWPRLVKNVMELKNAVCDLVWNIQNPEKMDLLNHLAERTRDGMKGDYRVDGQGWRGTVARTAGRLVYGCFRPGNRLGSPGAAATCPRHGCRARPRRTHPRWYGWTAETGVFGLRSPGSDALGDIPEHKFLVAINNVGLGHPSGGALLRSLAWFWCCSNFSRDWLLSFAQLFGQPMRWATYDPSDASIKDRLEEMMELMGSAAGRSCPRGPMLN